MAESQSIEATRAVSEFSFALVLLYRTKELSCAPNLDRTIDSYTEGLRSSLRLLVLSWFPDYLPLVHQPVRQKRRARGRSQPKRVYCSPPEVHWDPSSRISQIDAKRCKRLLLEIMKRAAHDWVLYRTSSRREMKELANDAFVWLFKEQPGHPRWTKRAQSGDTITSFLAVCEALDLDADKVRDHIRKLDVPAILNVGRPAETRKRPSRRIGSGIIEHALTDGVSIDAIDPAPTKHGSYYEGYYATPTLGDI